MALKIKGLWDITPDQKRARKYVIGADPPILPTGIEIRSQSPSYNAPFGWLQTGQTYNAIFTERWRDNGELYHYSGFSMVPKIQVNKTYSFTSAAPLPSVAGIKYYRDVEIQENGGVKFIPPDPQLPVNIVVILPFGYLTDITLKVTTDSIERVWIRELSEYVTHYRRTIAPESYIVQPITITLDKKTTTGNGTVTAVTPMTVRDNCSTSYSDKNLWGSYYPTDDAWLGVFAQQNYPIQTHIADGNYSLPSIVNALGAEKQTPINYPLPGNYYGFNYRLDQSLVYIT